MSPILASNCHVPCIRPPVIGLAWNFVLDLSHLGSSSKILGSVKSSCKCWFLREQLTGLVQITVSSSMGIVSSGVLAPRPGILLVPCGIYSGT